MNWSLRSTALQSWPPRKCAVGTEPRAGSCPGPTVGPLCDLGQAAESLCFLRWKIETVMIVPVGPVRCWKDEFAASDLMPRGCSCCCCYCIIIIHLALCAGP